MNTTSQEAMQAELAAKQSQLAEQTSNPAGTVAPVQASITPPTAPTPGQVATTPPVAPMDTSVQSNGTAPSRSTFDPNFSSGVNSMNQGVSMGDHMFKKQGASIGPLALLIKPLVAKIGAKIFAKGVGKSLAKNVAKKAVTNAVSKGKDDSQVESSQLAQASPASGNKEGGNEKAASSGYSGSAMYDNYNGSSMNAGFVKLPLEVQKNILKNKK
tara:strand:+ start:1868 stop:2509 length:642 start_codon:yes stop_codon:yes gene_type:complete